VDGGAPKNSGTAALLRLRCRLASGMPPEG